jgi:hypothetical protein
MSGDPSPQGAREPMSTPQGSEEQQAREQQARELQARELQARELPARNLSQAGLIFIYTGMGTWAVAVVVASVILVIREIYPERAVTCFSNYSLPILLVVASVIFLGCGYLILRTVRPPPPPRLQEGAENEA